jgi:hypothetical protein
MGAINTVWKVNWQADNIGGLEKRRILRKAWFCATETGNPASCFAASVIPQKFVTGTVCQRAMATHMKKKAAFLPKISFFNLILMILVSRTALMDEHAKILCRCMVIVNF